MLERWMRLTLLATAGMNIFGALAFVPMFPFARHLVGLPDAPPFYLWLLGIWIVAFGMVYLRLGLSGRPDRSFITIGAIGKLSFWFLLLVYWLKGEFSPLAPLAGGGDLMFGLIFVYWLWRSPQAH